MPGPAGAGPGTYLTKLATPLAPLPARDPTRETPRRAAHASCQLLLQDSCWRRSVHQLPLVGRPLPWPPSLPSLFTELRNQVWFCVCLAQFDTLRPRAASNAKISPFAPCPSLHVRLWCLRIQGATAPQPPRSVCGASDPRCHSTPVPTFPLLCLGLERPSAPASTPSSP